MKKMIEMLTREIKCSEVANLLINQIRVLKSFTEIHGIGLIGAAVLTNILQIIIPPIIFVVAGPIPSAISFFALGNGPTLFYYQAATYFKNQKSIMKETYITLSLKKPILLYLLIAWTSLFFLSLTKPYIKTVPKFQMSP